MSSAVRRIVGRMLGVVLGVAALGVGGFIGLGWLLSPPRQLMQHIVGDEMADWLRDWYAPRVAKLLPQDRDGDGKSDGYEWYAGTDPRIAQNSWPEPLYYLNRSWLGYVDERKTIRWVLVEQPRIPFPRTFTVTVSADSPVLLSPGQEGPASRGPLVIKVNSSGELEFDFLATQPGQIVTLTFVDAVNGATVSGELWICGHRLPPEITPYFSHADGRPLVYAPPEEEPERPEAFYHAWERRPGAAGYVVERRRRTPGANWEVYRWPADTKTNSPLIVLYDSIDEDTGSSYLPRDRPLDFEYRVFPVDAMPKRTN